MTRHGDPGSINPYRSPRRSPRTASMRSNAERRGRCVVHDVPLVPDLEWESAACLLCVRQIGVPEPLG